MTEIYKRKTEHLDIVLHGQSSVAGQASGFDHLALAHCALPELNLADVDLSVDFLGKRLAAPIVISSMTGGPDRSDSLNTAIARACNALGLAFGVGSQRIALEGGAAAGFSRALRQLAPDVPILANFGAAQLKQWTGPDMARRAVDMIAADGLIVHLNPLQEAVQFGGDTDWSGILGSIGALCRACDFPIICKEVGGGLSAEVARQLLDAGVAAIDVAGAGGTSWAAVEAERAAGAEQRAIALAFRDWGIPTAKAVSDAREACPNALIIGSGGLRNGVDCAKCIRLGADLAGFAAGVLPAAVQGPDALISHLRIIIAQLRIACFCTGSADLSQLRRVPLIAAG